MRYDYGVSELDVLVVSSHAPDLEAFGSALGRHLSGELRGLRVQAKSVGIGLAGVSGTLAARMADARPKAVVLVGTCAAYPGRNLSVGQVVVAERLVVADGAVLKGWAAFPDPMTGVIEPHRVMTSALASTGTRRVTVASTLAVTIDPSLAQAFSAQLRCDVEHQEAFGVALACAPTHVPCAIVLGVSHEVGPAARETWRVSHRQAAVAASTLVLSWLQAGGAGVPHGAA